VLTAALAAAGFVAGLTGAWSPCGFSIVETLGAAERRRTLAGACAAFTVGTFAGATATFEGLAALGRGVPASAAVAAAAMIAFTAAVAEAAGVQIVPQVRRQVPESWRRRLPLPVAAAGYGVLLGLGFATFVLTLAFWALAGIALVLGSLRLGLALGLGFGAGRALPIVVLAPLAGRRVGRDLLDAMASRPLLLRGLRLVDALALAACAGAVLAGGASAASLVVRGAANPSAEAGLVAWQGTSGTVLRYDLAQLGGATAHHHVGVLRAPLPGRDPAVGEGLVAWRVKDLVQIVRGSDFVPVAEMVIRGVNALAVSQRWLAYRASGPRGDRIGARLLTPARAKETVAASGGLGSLGRPVLDGNLLAFHVASRQESRIVVVDVGSGRRQVVRRSTIDQLTNPSIARGTLLYVRASSTSQRLELGPLDRPRGDRVLLRSGPTANRDLGHDRGYSRVTRTPTPRRAKALFWTTALAPGSAYLTLLPLRGELARSRIVRLPVGRPGAGPPVGSEITVGTPPPAPVLAYTASSRSKDALALVGVGGDAVLADAGRLEDPSWSPDGTRLTFAGPRGLYVLDVGGAAAVRITRDAADADPEWAPDGALIAFVRSGHISVVRPDGTGLRRITRGRGRDEEPSWSPDGKLIAFASRRERNWDLYAIDLAGRERRLTRTRTAEGWPTWSPDGHELAFDRRTPLGLRIYVMQAGGGTARRLTGGPGDDFHSAWSPEGARIAFVSDRQGRPRLFTASLDGGTVTALGTAPGIQDAPAWRPLAHGPLERLRPVIWHRVSESRVAVTSIGSERRAPPSTLHSNSWRSVTPLDGHREPRRRLVPTSDEAASPVDDTRGGGASPVSGVRMSQRATASRRRFCMSHMLSSGGSSGSSLLASEKHVSASPGRVKFAARGPVGSAPPRVPTRSRLIGRIAHSRCLRVVKPWSNGDDRRRQEVAKGPSSEAASLSQQRRVEGRGEAFHRNRTQGVAGSSPASSIPKRPANAGFTIFSMRTKLGKIDPRSSFGQIGATGLTAPRRIAGFEPG
jgi:WD40 repeat protein